MSEMFSSKTCLRKFGPLFPNGRSVFNKGASETLALLCCSEGENMLLFKAKTKEMKRR